MQGAGGNEEVVPRWSCWEGLTPLRRLPWGVGVMCGRGWDSGGRDDTWSPLVGMSV